MYDPEQAGLLAVFDRLEAKRHPVVDPDAENVAASMREANRLAQGGTKND